MLNFQFYYILSYNKYQIIIYIYGIRQPGGPYWEKLCSRSSGSTQASSGTQDRGHGFSQYGPTRPDLFPLNLTESFPEESE